MSAIISWRGRVRAVVIGGTVRVSNDLAGRSEDDPEVVWIAALADQALDWPQGVTWDLDIAARAARALVLDVELFAAAMRWCRDSRQLACLCGVPVDVVEARLRDRDVRDLAGPGVSGPGGRRGPGRVPRRRGAARCAWTGR